MHTDPIDKHSVSTPHDHALRKTDAEHPGYEVTDVNTKGVVVFIGGLVAFLFVFFLLCYGMGMAINSGLLRQDRTEAAKNPFMATGGGTPAGLSTKGRNLADNASLEQGQAAILAQSFPTPRLDADDSNMTTADLHFREDLLLDHYTIVQPGEEGTPGAVRIPIEKAMQLILQRGLPQAQAAPGAQGEAKMVGDRDYTVHPPLTDGFARTAYELDEMETREQKMKMEGQVKANPGVSQQQIER